MPHRHRRICLLGVCVLLIPVMMGLSLWRGYAESQNKAVNKNTYFDLPPDPYAEDPLRYLDEDFTVQEGFHSNLPIIILSMEEELADYKGFDGQDNQEYLTGEEIGRAHV